MYVSRAIATFMRGVPSRSISAYAHDQTFVTRTRPAFVSCPMYARIRMSTTATNDGRDTRTNRPPIKMEIVTSTEIVTRQRLNRPVSPHLSIYSWEIMICGALHRNTAVLLSGTIYLFGLSYLVLPFFGVPLGTAELVALFGNLPLAVKMMVRWIYGFALSFHFAHGLRHLIWDTGAMLTNAQVKKTGIAALAVGVLAATGLCITQ